MIPDETIDRAVTAFHDAIDAHIDDAPEIHSREGDWVDASAEAVAEALLLNGWTPPTD